MGMKDEWKDDFKRESIILDGMRGSNANIDFNHRDSNHRDVIKETLNSRNGYSRKDVDFPGQREGKITSTLSFFSNFF